MQDLNVMIIGRGGRAHAVASAYEKSDRVNSIIVVPGNDLISYRSKKEILCIRELSVKNVSKIIDVAKKYKVDVVEVTSTRAMAVGVVERLKEEGFKVFGPTKDSARIETDKVWARNFMKRNNIAHPKYDVFDTVEKAKEYIKGVYKYNPDKELFVKASGLCSGRGVFQVENLEQARVAIDKINSLVPGEPFLIEEALHGDEVSLTVVTDGKHYYRFKTAHNEKHSKNFDHGPLTRGMGGNAPFYAVEKNKDLMHDVDTNIIHKTLSAISKEGMPYQGILSVVLKMSFEGDRIEPKVIEYNARWGDPEVEVILPGVKTDWVDIVDSSINLTLDRIDISEDNLTRVGIVGASRGYPGDFSQVKGKIVFGMDNVIENDDVRFFGSAIDLSNEHFYANGGRLFYVVGSGNNVIEAKEKAYSAMSKLSVEGNNLHYRTDIAWKDTDIYYMERI